MHEGISVKALLDSGATGLFMSKKYMKKGGFKLMKLEKPILVRNVDGTGNSGGAIQHDVHQYVNNIWTRRKWVQKLREEGKERKKSKRMKLKGLGGLQIRKRTGKERRK